MHKFLFSEKMKLADLISANHYLILMLPRFGISLGFGDKSVAEVCGKYNVPVDFFLLVCNINSFDTYLPERQTIRATNMRFLIPYLLASHRYYMHERLPHIRQHLEKITGKADARYGSVLMRFFDMYRREVTEHFVYEEKKVFPYIEALAAGEKDESFNIHTFLKSHGDIEDKLNDLTQIIFKYLPGNEEPDESIEVVFDIFQLSSDLNKHTLLEEKILVPYVEMLEKGAV